MMFGQIPSWFYALTSTGRPLVRQDWLHWMAVDLRTVLQCYAAYTEKRLEPRRDLYQPPMIRVFLSMGHTHSDIQSRCVDVLGSYLKEHGIITETLGQSFWSTEKPLRPIRQRMRREYGAVVLAMERFHSFEGVYEEGGQFERAKKTSSFPLYGPI